MEKIEQTVVDRGQVFDKTKLRFTLSYDQFEPAPSKLVQQKDPLITMETPISAFQAANMV